MVSWYCQSLKSCFVGGLLGSFLLDPQVKTDQKLSNLSQVFFFQKFFLEIRKKIGSQNIFLPISNFHFSGDDLTTNRFLLHL